ncbi:unnamed protein product [Linum trigynum]|uniref:Uncharacterized protein n=1 Tax=Linum trigynum TaxID=586398 RepID=A0AAV2CXQ6_9ROSI
MAGLKPEIVAAVRVFESDSLKSAFHLAGHKEEELASWRSTMGRYQRPSGGGSGSGTGEGGGGSTVGAGVSVIAATTAGVTLVAKGESRQPPKGFFRLSPA